MYLSFLMVYFSFVMVYLSFVMVYLSLVMVYLSFGMVYLSFDVIIYQLRYNIVKINRLYSVHVYCNRSQITSQRVKK